MCNESLCRIQTDSWHKKVQDNNLFKFHKVLFLSFDGFYTITVSQWSRLQELPVFKGI